MSSVRTKGSKPDNANLPYEVIFGYLAGLRRGTADRAWLQLTRMPAGDWPAPIQRHLAGEIDRAALLQAARDAFDMRTNEQQCEAYFTLGQIALAAGDKETAIRELENCVQSGVVGFIEYDLARRDLVRLRPAPVSTPAPEPVKSAPAAPEAKPAGRGVGDSDGDDGSSA